MALLVFDIASAQSFESLQRWLEEVRANASEHIRIIVVGNKADLEDRRAVQREVAQEWATSIGAPYF